MQLNFSEKYVHHHYNVDILNLFDPELKFKFKVHKVLILDYKKRNDCKIFHSSVQIIVSDLDTEREFNSNH